ncbi:putative heavy metal transport/detoxification protein [Dokdonia sp. MED134]|uniref:heavy-metal-associated domain-containing protein n=1 Tax=Dokdonia sp. MED134 TaxID=313590 RepID=UPI000068AA22|nr:heavy metal-associated domain-containing protein [Dokdonia sp. MED134]EAQ40415.1 putative heavy metal transport/detoxification protein [Dokdonia sp. MED134]
MKHTYNIQGMTCNGCRTSVEQKLSQVDGVTNATVNLEKEEAIVEMDSHIDTTTFQKALPEKYTISEKKVEKNVFANSDNGNVENVFSEAENEKSKLQQLKPLLIILGYISIATVLLNYNRENWDGAMLDFMGLFFIVFSFFKILDLKGFPESFKMYDPLAKVMPTYGWVYPFVETALGLMFLMRFEIPIALISTLIILGTTTVGVTKILLDKKSIQCACLGTALKLPMTEATFIENAIMIVMAVVMLIKYIN